MCWEAPESEPSRPYLPRKEGMAPVRPRKNSASAFALKLRSVDNSRLIAGCELDRCVVAQHQGGRSWPNARRHQKYKSEQSCEEETQLDAVRDVGCPRLRRRQSERFPGPSPNPRQWRRQCAKWSSLSVRWSKPLPLRWSSNPLPA